MIFILTLALLSFIPRANPHSRSVFAITKAMSIGLGAATCGIAARFFLHFSNESKTSMLRLFSEGIFVYLAIFASQACREATAWCENGLRWKHEMGFNCFKSDFYFVSPSPKGRRMNGTSFLRHLVSLHGLDSSIAMFSRGAQVDQLLSRKISSVKSEPRANQRRDSFVAEIEHVAQTDESQAALQTKKYNLFHAGLNHILITAARVLLPYIVDAVVGVHGRSDTSMNILTSCLVAVEWLFLSKVVLGDATSGGSETCSLSRGLVDVISFDSVSGIGGTSKRFRKKMPTLLLNSRENIDFYECIFNHTYTYIAFEIKFHLSAISPLFFLNMMCVVAILTYTLLFKKDADYTALSSIIFDAIVIMIIMVFCLVKFARADKNLHKEACRSLEEQKWRLAKQSKFNPTTRLANAELINDIEMLRKRIDLLPKQTLLGLDVTNANILRLAGAMAAGLFASMVRFALDVLE